jgi:chloramphenicol-sensitive protein RarD
VLLGIAAYAMWGVFPLYWPLLEPASALEILAHRFLWSLVFLVLLLTVTRGWGRLREQLRRGRSVRLPGSPQCSSRSTGALTSGR